MRVGGWLGGCGLVVGERVALLCSRLWRVVTPRNVAMGRSKLAPFSGVATRSTNRRFTVRSARPVQSAESKALNLVAVGSCPTVGAVSPSSHSECEQLVQATTNKQTRERKERRHEQATSVHPPPPVTR